VSSSVTITTDTASMFGSFHIDTLFDVTPREKHACPVPECGKRYVRESDLRSHFTLQHPTYHLQFPDLISIGKYRCEMCGARFSRRKILVKHLNQHSKDVKRNTLSQQQQLQQPQQHEETQQGSDEIDGDSDDSSKDKDGDLWEEVNHKLMQEVKREMKQEDKYNGPIVLPLDQLPKYHSPTTPSFHSSSFSSFIPYRSPDQSVFAPEAERPNGAKFSLGFILKQ